MRINCDPSKAHQIHLTLRNWRKICAGLWKGIVRGRSTIDKSMILLKMRCTLPHHSSSSKETGCCWMMKSGAGLASFCDFSIFINAPASNSCGSAWLVVKWREGYRGKTQKLFMPEPMVPMFERVLVNSRQANLILEMTEEDRYHFQKLTIYSSYCRGIITPAWNKAPYKRG